MAKDLTSFPDLTSGLNGIDLLADTIRKSSGQNTDQDKNTFKAIVLRATSGIQANNQELGGVLGSNDLSNSNRSRGGITRSYFVRIVEDSPHAYLPDPCVQGSTQLTETTNNQLIQGMHTYAVYQSAEALSPNDIVLLRLEKRDFGYDTDIGYIVGVVGQKEAAKVRAQEDIGCASPSNAYKNKKTGIEMFQDEPPPGDVPNNVVYTSLLPGLETAQNYQYISSSSPVSATLRSAVERELDFWKGKKESDADTYLTLKKYWDPLLAENEWSPSTAWSAAFVSYVVRRADKTFPGAIAHRIYADAAKRGEGNWSLWKTKENKITAQVGDVLVKAREGSPTNTHGDVVYKIENGMAFLAGGNLGNTARTAKTIRLTNEGYYSAYGSYEILLKKNGNVFEEEPQAVASL